MTTPYIGFSNETLRLLPDVKPGDMIGCDKCGKEHALEPAGGGSKLLMFYHCGGETFLGALNGKLVARNPMCMARYEIHDPN